MIGTMKKMTEVHETVVELLKWGDNLHLLDRLQKREIVLLKQVEIKQGMLDDDFDAISSTESGYLLALKRVDASQPISLKEKEKYIAMPTDKWELCQDRKDLTMDILNLQGKITRIPDEV